MRNPVGMAWEPHSGELWAVVNERDMLGSDLVPDYLTRVEFGAFYGWPWNYWGGYEDKRVEPGRPDLREYTHRPDYGLGAHTAALGLTRSEEHTSELQSLMRISYAVFCLKKKKQHKHIQLLILHA